MYDIDLEVKNIRWSSRIGNDFSPAPIQRKLLFTQFGPNVRLKETSDGWSDTLEIADFATLLPYYEVDVPVEKGKNTIKIRYKTFMPLGAVSRGDAHDILIFDLMRK